MNTQQSATPFPRADHRAKPHPKPTKWRRGLVRQACYEAIARELEVEL